MPATPVPILNRISRIQSGTSDRPRAQGVAFQQVQRGERPPDQALGGARDDHEELLGLELLGDVPLDGALGFEPVQTRLVEYGLPPLSALRAATLEAARLLGLDDEVGTLEVGKVADLIVVDGDPLAEPSLWRDPARVTMVVQGGKVVADRRSPAIRPRTEGTRRDADDAAIDADAGRGACGRPGRRGSGCRRGSGPRGRRAAGPPARRLAAAPDPGRHRLHLGGGLRRGAGTDLVDRWICLGRTEEIPGPGDYLVRELAGESLFVTRNRAGDLRAFYNICAHRGTKLLDDTGDVCGHANKAFKCPYHAWAFDLDGQLIGTPNVDEDETFERADFPLHAIAVDAYGGFLFVHLGESPRPLLDELREGTESITNFERYHLETLRIGRRIVYEVEANWKIVVENYNECLHCPTVHPELVQIVPLYRFGEVWDEETRDDGNWMIEGATSFTRTGRSTLPPFPDLSPDDRRMYYGTFQFPNVLLNLHPERRWSTRCTRAARATRRSSPNTCSRPRRSPRPTSRPTRWSSCGTSSPNRIGSSARGPSPGSRHGPIAPGSIRARIGSCTTSTSATARRWAGRASAERPAPCAASLSRPCKRNVGGLRPRRDRDRASSSSCPATRGTT